MVEPATDEASVPYAGVRRDGVLQVRHPGAEWLSSGANGGRFRADCAYNVAVPEGWNRTDLETYVAERLERAGFPPASEPGREYGRVLEVPALLTGVEMADVRGARCGPVTAYATAGISNPARLPMEPPGGRFPDASEGGDVATKPDSLDSSADDPASSDQPPGWGTVNVIVGTTRSLADGALANLLAVAAEAKAATLLAVTDVPGTTTDAIVAGYDPEGEPTQFTGSGTVVGTAARACVREAVRASLEAHYAGRDSSPQGAAIDAPYGVSTDVEAAVFEPDAR
ncbi:adenosylcobinamide amidohydrolase [Natrarchaeobaculum aegyptiacum]|uniref:Adenosylcobinamide amidohydrolase n=1 Tax=Natrarchaeobaculum aegyptiacum TaxID=745377 RepID=A0A2Z2HX23_9EURY|nr:adenosylcobinamide amidohydrolase [Natrarchaeobaculum aegyptiacum]